MQAFGPYLVRAAGRSLSNAAKVLLFVAQPVATDRDNLSQAGPKPVGVAAKKTRDGRLVIGAAEQTRIRTLNATLPRKALRPRDKFYSRNERGRHLRRRQINRMTK